MRIRIYFRWLLAVLLAVGSLAAQASHLRGGEITFASIPSTTAGVPRYHVVLREFVEAISPIVGLSPTVPLTASRAGCGAVAPNMFTLNAPLTSSVAGSPQVCSSTTAIYWIGLYEVDVDLPTGQWILSTYTLARSSAIQNITNPTGVNFYISAYLDNTSVAQDSSPKFESLLQPSIASGALAPMHSSFSAFDADGDSLRYEFTLPYNSCGQLVPSTLAPDFGLHASTGALLPSVIPSTQGLFDQVVIVSEYRKLGANRWSLIGSVMRDNVYMVYSTTNQPPAFTTMKVNTGPVQMLGTTTPAIVAQPGQAVTVMLQATDPDAGQTLRFASNAPNVVPGLSMAGTATSVQLTWQVPATLAPGRYAIPIAVLDNGCTYNASEERTLTFVIGNATLATRNSLLATAEVYPTPFHDQVQFKASPNQVVILFDALGREVARLTSAADGLVRWQPTAALPAGLYLARAAADGQPLARLLRAE